MLHPNRIVDTLIHRRAIISLCILACALELLFLLRMLYPPAFEFILDYHIFEIVVLCSLTQIVLLLLHLVRRTPWRICTDEIECQETLREFLRLDSRAKSLHVLSAGLGSRMDLITTVPKEPHPLRTEVLAQAPKRAIDSVDAARMENILDILKQAVRGAGQAE